MACEDTDIRWSRNSARCHKKIIGWIVRYAHRMPHTMNARRQSNNETVSFRPKSSLRFCHFFYELASEEGIGPPRERATSDRCV